MAQKPKRNKAKKSAGKKVEPAKIIGVIPGAGAGSDGRTLDGLYAVIKSRRGADPARSHTARMFLRGPAKIAQKFGEEAVEAVIEGALKESKALVLESADVLYHLLVLWAACGVKPDQVWKELKRREVRSGIAEKAARKLAPLGKATGSKATGGKLAGKTTKKAAAKKRAPR
ncbi:MAG TPA: phosphoribosyl-ATP diphosphatase [Alphaproteobacteria bacterium]